MDKRVQTDALLRLVEDLGKIDDEALGQTVVEALNDTLDSAYELSRKAVLRGINLTERYVDARMRTQRATRANPEAAIIAPIGKGYFTNLSHYGAMVETQPTKNLTGRKGAPHLGIPPGQKLKSMTAEVTKGARKSVGKKFTLPNIKDSEGNPLVFRNIGPGGKSGKGRIEAVFGPSVYQLARVAFTLVEDDVGLELERRVADAAEAQLKRFI